MPAALIWLLLGLALLLVELLGADFDGLLAGAIAALVLSLLSGLATWPPLLQVASFAGLTAALLALLARWSRRRSPSIPAAGSGEHGAVISGFGPSSEGRVRWQGQSWAAVNLAPERPLQSGEPVLVMGRDGTRLQVLPEADAP